MPPKCLYVDRLRFERDWRGFLEGIAWSGIADPSAMSAASAWLADVPFFVVRARDLATGRGSAASAGVCEISGAAAP